MAGGRALPGAASMLEALSGRFAIVSNDAEHTPDELARRLRRLGLAVTPDCLVLAGVAAIDRLAEAVPGGRVLLLASPSLARYARARGLRVTEDRCDAVLVGRDRRFTYRRLAAAAAAVAGGARFYVACPDGSHAGGDGRPVPEAGALAAAVSAAAGVAAHEVIGKPEPLLFRLGCARLGIDPSHAVMIGDNAATDGAGASRLGMRFLKVRPGELDPGLLDSLQSAA